MPRHLRIRNGLFYYYRRVPEVFASVDPRTFAEVGLGTRDLRRAERLRDDINKAQEALWTALKKGGSADARERYLTATERARIEGFEYRSVADLAGAELFESEKRTLLEVLRHYRNAVIASGTHLHHWSRTYQLGGPVIAAIDDLAGELTGDRTFFHTGSST